MIPRNPVGLSGHEACIRNHLNEFHETTSAGEHVLWLPVWLHGR
jgi:hypothetical protein